MTPTSSAPHIELSSDQLDRLHRIQLSIAARVKNVCDAHDLEYFLMSGSLLGAIRNGGFIPWDDDMDLGMPRDSYDKFLAVASHEMGPEIFVQSLESDPGYGLTYAKLRLNGTKLVEASSANSGAHEGIFVDLFPFDNVPDAGWLRRLHASSTWALTRIVILQQGYAPWFASGRIKSLVHRSAVPLAKLPSKSLMVSLLNKSMRWFNATTTSRMTAIGGSYGYKRESVERRWIEPLTEVEFENTQFKCLNGATDYLTQVYGDYMTPPPPENRSSRHGLLELDFGDSAPS